MPGDILALKGSELKLEPEGMLIQVWCPTTMVGIALLKEITELGFVSIPELAEWYHRNGSILDISPAPIRKQEDVWIKDERDDLG